MIRNIVFNELLYRYGSASAVAVGRERREIDFVCEKDGGRLYFRVIGDIFDTIVRERRMKPLDTVKDSCPKTVISPSRYLSDNIRGIRIVTLLDFLTEDQREQVGLPARMGIRTCSAL
ncbi:hypothetical protein AUQ37_01130 [Candidatus Methanomethylophilus sp. 1R26]|uniref:hypothetical protein n=1 Tax=Candidatus Methanomethylophilus sp. 1R26 TaxID=1769296 RepID=UPI0007369AB7|nr:hypothetical protein [Candidatus Methanomethylophilus sp. 1R26]KUE73940.1 hypothetical protein AUQ37_01130 [Candidatus Methanomethylophilus sp. 1R26]TQS76779.1 MAG: hypothetical protein A3Q59_02600 [Methanomethylophilus alvi]